MTRKLTVAAVVLAGLVFAPGVQAGSNTDRATGGGQVLVSTDGTGAGTTIAFTARGTEATARGEVQVIDRAAGRGRSSVRYHGTVVCLRVEGNTAKLAGNWDRPGGTFQLIVVDNGEGANSDNDVVTLQNADDPTCAPDEPNDDDGQTFLARGNAQVYDATPPAE